MPLPNGQGVLLLIDITGTPTVIGSQRDYSQEEVNDTIDVSSKDSGREGEYLVGRYSANVSCEAVYVPSDAAQALLFSAARDGTEIVITRQEDGTDVETANALVERVGFVAPDQDAALLSVDLRLSGAWTSV